MLTHFDFKLCGSLTIDRAFIRDIKIMNLTELGWNDFFQGQLDATEEEFIPARVARLDGAGYQLLSEGGNLATTLPGKLRFAATTRADLPCVGDWVLVTELVNEPGKAVMHQLLERKSSFSRKEASVRTEEHRLFTTSGTRSRREPG